MLNFARTLQLVGQDKFDKLKDSHVVICGLGAVGSYAAEALARAGVGHLRLVEFDTVDVSNINRQLYALNSTVNSPKIKVAEKRIKDINPDCKLDLRDVFINDKTVHDILEPPADILVDAIDSVSSKVHLIKHAIRKNFHVVSCMGAAGRLDANLVTTGDLSETHTCPLARIIRRRLHRHDIYDGVRCVYSTEPALNKNPPVVEETKCPDSTERGRGREPIGSISYVTGIAGLKTAYEVINHILNR